MRSRIGPDREELPSAESHTSESACSLPHVFSIRHWLPLSTAHRAHRMSRSAGWAVTTRRLLHLGSLRQPRRARHLFFPPGSTALPIPETAADIERTFSTAAQPFPEHVVTSDVVDVDGVPKKRHELLL